MMRIYTEDVNRDRIVSILDSHFDGYTVIPTLGRWKGVNESSLLIELVTDDRDKVVKAAEQIKAANRQESVLVTDAPVCAEFV